MNKQKRPEVKKTLVRNASRRAVSSSKSVSTVAPLTRQSTSKVSSLSSQMSRLSVNTRKCSGVAPTDDGNTFQVVCEPVSKAKFRTPDLQTILILSKKIDEVVEPRRIKSSSDVDKNRLALGEKITRKVNFPQDKQIFKGLIPISNNEKKTRKVISVRDPKPLKDPEPKVENFMDPIMVTRQVNYPVNQAVFKNLIPLPDYPKMEKIHY